MKTIFVQNGKKHRIYMEKTKCVNCNSEHVEIIEESDTKGPNGEAKNIYICQACGAEFEQ